VASSTFAPAPEKAPQASHGSIPSLIGEWIRQGTEGFIATQKILLDLAAQQNALVLTIIRERLGGIKLGPSNAVLDLIAKGVHNFMEAQRIVLDIAARQSAILSDGLKPGIAGTPVEGLAEVVRQGLDNFLGAQKLFLDQFEAQTEGAIADYRDGKGFDAGRLAELARDGMKDFIQSQKKFLDIIETEMLSKKERPRSEDGHVDLFGTAQQSVDALVEAEKRLLDLASSQVDVDVKMVREVFSARTEPRPTTALPELMKKSVDSFVAAQKALVELASRPRDVHEQPEDEPVAAEKA
jgi:hypothetical protein